MIVEISPQSFPPPLRLPLSLPPHEAHSMLLPLCPSTLLPPQRCCLGYTRSHRCSIPFPRHCTARAAALLLPALLMVLLLPVARSRPSLPLSFRCIVAPRSQPLLCCSCRGRRALSAGGGG